jgi:hypothetical protein
MKNLVEEAIAAKSRRGRYTPGAPAHPRHTRAGVVGICLVMMLASTLAMVLVGGAQASPTGPAYGTIKVPCGASIQSAINAAPSGGTIVLAPCTYVQQLTIDKSVSIVGAGAGRTTIQSPGVLAPDAYGNPWTIEVGNAATVTLSGFTLVVTLQCILTSPYAALVFQPGYAGGGIGVGGSASLSLQSAVVTTSGVAQGASCDNGAGFMSFGTGVDFGLDYVAGAPASSQLIGFGTVSTVAISGFGLGGPGIAVGGTVDSPAGSHAMISNDRIQTLGVTGPYTGGAPLPSGVVVGVGQNASTATIVGNVMTGVAGTSSFPIWVLFGSSAYIAHNSLISTGWANGISVEVSSTATITDNSIVIGNSAGGVAWGEAWGIFVYEAQATITYNSISGPSLDGVGIYMLYSSATIEYNEISQMTCEANPPLGTLGGATCGPSFATQFAGYGILDESDAGLGTVIANNLIVANDVGILLWSGCPACVVKNNVLLDNVDYGLAGMDGNCTFLQNLVVGGAYGVGAIAFTLNTTVTLTHVVIVGPSVAPIYYEIDFPGGTATVAGTWTVI